MNFNGNASTIDILESSDGFGHMMLTQRRQGVGASFFDTTQYTYDASFLIHSVSMPCSANAGQGCSTTVTTTTYDGLSRPSLITDAGGGTVSYSYPANDVLVTAGPAPAGENTKRRQMQYDGLGRLTSVCEITSAAGSGPCAQSSAQTGFWAKYGYDALGNLTSVNQNAQGSPIQTRTFSYDALSRVTSESNPESGTTTYAYDSVNSGGCVLSLPGNMILKTDANGNGDCYGWDALHRLLSIGQSFSSPNAAATPDHCFIYDSAIVNGQTMTKTKGRMAEAYTVAKGAGCGAAKLTDEGLGYDADGRQTDLYQSTPHSAGYYHAAVSYWANNALHTLSGFFASGSTFVPTQTYTPDGEGRWKSVAASSGPNPISNTLYNPASQITALTYGSTDSDSFDYDNAGRMKNYTFKVNGSSEVSAPTWNPNGTLKSLAITADPFNAGNVQTCTYAYDDLARLTSANCGTPWSQTFSYDAFGNISKTGSVSWACATCYNTNKNQYNSTLSPSISYDANGNLLNDSFRTYAWDALGRPVSIGSKTMTYDALGRMVEKFDGAYTQFVYTPAGGLLARTSGQSATSVRVPLPDSWAVYGSGNSFNHYEHLDWLGNSRLSSTQSRTPTTDVAYAPFGEPYASTATSGVSFTGMRSDVAAVSGSVTNGLYDFLEREYPPTQGRWLSPDPAGTGAANPTNPQSWNRYAYVLNNPLTYVDPLGLWHCDWGNGDADPPENQGGASESTCIHDGGDGAGWAPDPGDFSEELVFDGSSIIQGSSDLSSVALGPGESGSASFGSGDFQEGSLAWNVFGPPSAALWSSAANTMNKLTAGYSAAFAGVLAAPALGTATVNIAARATGLYYGLFGSGTGVVLGQYDKYSNYLQAAKSIGANALNVPTRYADFFATRGQWLTLNNSFLQGSILRGQQFFMSSPVLGATGNFAQELQYLTSHGIGPEQWQMVPLPY
jgi:RHS repeat-associated protein